MSFLLSLTLIWPALSAQSFSDSTPLTQTEQRKILFYLLELETSRRQVALLRTFLTQEQEQAARELELSERERELAADRIKLLEDRLALEVERTEFYRNAYEALLSRGFCWRRLFTLGIFKCR